MSARLQQMLSRIGRDLNRKLIVEESFEDEIEDFDYEDKLCPGWETARFI